VIVTTVIVPTIELFCTTSVLLLAESRHPLGTLAYCFRLRQMLKPWNMVEIFMLGALVAIVKFGGLARVQRAPAFFLRFCSGGRMIK